MKILIPLIIIFLLNQNFFGQEDKTKPSLKEISKSKGKIPLELYYPVDMAIFETVNSYLDSNFKFTDWPNSKGKYILTQHALGYFKVEKFGKKAPYGVKLDSFVLVKMELNTVQHKRIIKGHLLYKRLFSRLDYNIKNGYTTSVKVYSRRGTRLKVFCDFSGFYAENKTWPIFTRYRRNGKIKMINKDLYYGNSLMWINWKP